MRISTVFAIQLLASLIQAQSVRKMKYEMPVDSLRNAIVESMNNYSKVETEGRVFAIVMPHMADISHDVDAAAVKQILGESYDRVIIICNSHRGAFPGIKIDANDEWETPLGTVKTDKEFADILINEGELFKYDSTPFALDHTMELALPFLQTAIEGEFRIVPILFGNSYYVGKDINDNYQKVAELLTENMTEKDLLVITSDMTHFYTNEEKQRYVDTRQIELIKSADIAGLERFEHELAIQPDGHKKILNCAIDGIKTMLEMYSKAGGRTISKLDYNTFYDENRKRFISYSSWVLSISD